MAVRRLIGGAVLLCMAALAQAAEKVRVFGDRYTHPLAPTEFVRTYVDMPKDHDGDTMPIAVGVQITPGFSRAADDLPFNWDGWPVPIEGNPSKEQLLPYKAFEMRELRFPQVGRNPFKFNSWTYNLYGHPPVGTYDYQHYDVRFFYVEPEEWWGHFTNDTYGGPCGAGTPEIFYEATKPLPEGCYPGSTKSVINIGNFIWGQGARLYNMAEEQWTNKEFNDVRSVTYGIFGGNLDHIETMISRHNAMASGYSHCFDLTPNVPKHFRTAHAAPTEICWEMGDTAFKVEMRKFVNVPGGCDDMQNGTLVGYALPFGYKWLGPRCTVMEP